MKFKPILKELKIYLHVAILFAFIYLLIKIVLLLDAMAIF